MRLVLLALLLAPLTAHADPATFTAIGTWLGTATAIGLTYGQIIFMVGATIYGSAQQRKLEKKARRQQIASLQDRTVTAVATESPHVYVYGRARVGSRIVAMFTSGEYDEYRHLVCVHADHECDAVEEIYVAGRKIEDRDGNGWVLSGEFAKITTEWVSANYPKTQTTIELAHEPVDGNVTVLFSDGGSGGEPVAHSLSGTTLTILADLSMFSGQLWVQYSYRKTDSQLRVATHLGGPNDPADARLISDVPDKWNENCVLRGKCYSVVTLDLTNAEFQNGVPLIEVVLRGKKLYNFRTGETAWSQNPPEAIYDYLTSEICGVDASDLPLAQFIAAANACDESYSFGNRYTINGTVTSDEDQKGVLERMAQCMAGSIASTTWDIQAGAYTAPVMALDQSDIAGSITITPGFSDSDLYNGVRGQYISPENSYVATDFVPYQNASLLDADGREMWTDIDFAFTDTLQRVHNLCRIFVEDQRNGYTVRGQFSLKAWKLKVGNRVTLTSELFGWNGKVFRVTDKRFSPTSAVELTLKEDAATIWDGFDQVTLDPTPNTGLPNPFNVSPLASLSWTSGTNDLLVMADGTVVSRIHATWPQAALASGAVEVEWRHVAADGWYRTQVSGDATEAYLSPVQDGAYYAVRARVVNPYLNAKSDWIYAPMAKVVGKTEPPPDITDLSISGSVLSWSPVEVLDLKGYVFRFHYGNNRDWGSAAPLHTGVIPGAPFDLMTRPGGLVTIMGKAVDTTGNASVGAAIVVTELGDPPVANVVEEIDLRAEGFLGSSSGASIVSGDLVADSTDSAYGTGNQSFYGADTAPLYDLSTFSEMVYTSREIAVVSALAGSVMTLEIDSQGADLTVEYRLAGPGAVYGEDDDSAFGDEAEPFYDTPGSWIPWPGQITAANDVYQFRVTLGTGAVQGKILGLKVVIDAPDIEETLQDVPVSASGTVVPYTSNFTAIKTVTVQLQANSSGAVTVETDKTNNLAPVIKAYNAAHAAVGGATVDITLKGY